MRAMILPFVAVRGSWGEMGLQVGQMFAPLIARHVAAWLQHVSEETGCTHDAALATAATFSAPIQEHKARHNILVPRGGGKPTHSNPSNFS
jgi:nitrate/nitrite transporter NarK